MKVSELIELLKKQPQDMEAQAFSAAGYTYLGQPQVHVNHPEGKVVLYGKSPRTGDLVELVFTERQMEFLQMAVSTHMDYGARDENLHYLHHIGQWEELKRLIEAKLKRGGRSE